MSASAANQPVATERQRRPRRLRSGGGHALVARGEPMVWLTGGAMVTCLLMILGLLVLVLWQGMGTFWPKPLVQVTTTDGKAFLGEVAKTEMYRPATHHGPMKPTDSLSRRRLLRTGNFDVTGTHFTWVADTDIAEQHTPDWAIVLERRSWGRFYGIPVGFEANGQRVAETPEQVWQYITQLRDEVRQRAQRIGQLESQDMGRINRRVESARLGRREAELGQGLQSPQWQRANATCLTVEAQADQDYARVAKQIRLLRDRNAQYKILMRTADGQDAPIALADVVRAYPANQLSLTGKLGIYLSRWWEFLSEDPREANSEGGVFPALFGTAMMALLMSIVVVPFGVLAALYLREYAKPGLIVSVVRIAINNLAGVPSIVFGVFGLGFFCYGVGGFIDSGPTDPWPQSLWWAGTAVLAATLVSAILLSRAAGSKLQPGETIARQRTAARFAVILWLITVAVITMMIAKNPYFQGLYRASLPNPTFGKGAMLWASLTLALLTLPVVIVATEEAIAAVPNSMREGSYACGASKWQTIRRIVLPRAMPGIMTGTILAMARGAGEVAPLMLVGAVKLAPELPIDWHAPFGMNRSFMHLGFHIYDLGFQSQNSEAAKPMVYTTTLLLIALVASMNITAIWLRSRLHRRFAGTQF